MPRGVKIHWPDYDDRIAAALKSGLSYRRAADALGLTVPALASRIPHLHKTGRLRKDEHGAPSVTEARVAAGRDPLPVGHPIAMEALARAATIHLNELSQT